MVDVKLLLLLSQVRRVDVGDRAVAIPFEEGKIRILSHQFVDYTERIILYFRIAHVENQLVTVVVSLPVGQMDGPIRMLLEQLALGVDHFRLDPDAELYASLFRRFHQVRNTIR